MDRHKKVVHEYQDDLLRRNHVVGVGYGIKEKNGQKIDEEAIMVLVDKKLSPDRLQTQDMVPQTLANYQTDVIETGTFEMQKLRTNKMRPARPGVSVGHYKISAGTLGAIVKDNKTGKPLILSNNHVLANISNGKDGRAKKGDPVLQPGKYDNGSEPEDVLGFLHRFIPLKSGKEDEATCPIAKTVERLTNSFLKTLRPDYKFKLYKEGIKNLVDCAVAKPKNENEVKSSILDIGEVKGVRDPEVGLRVQKSGRTTGLTSGKIKVKDTTVEVKMTQDEKAQFKDQFITEPLSEAGDSGSLVLDEDNKAVGLLFAGSKKATVCNKIDNVLKALKVRF